MITPDIVFAVGFLLFVGAMVLGLYLETRHIENMIKNNKQTRD